MPLSLMLTTLALAGEPDDAEAHYGVCVHCHGAHGEGRPELGTPRLGDLSPDYVRIQLQAFRDGTRGAHPSDTTAQPMVAIGGGLSDRSLEVLPDFVAALDPEYRPTGPRVSRGRALYGPCVACHGADARGNDDLKAPDLLFQDTRYLERQLRHYRDGVRGGPDSHPYAMQMAAMAQGLSDADISAVVGHIASLRPPRPPLDQYPVTLSEEEGLAAFDDIYAAATHPRCMNCHPDGDRPLHTDESIPHDFGITRHSPFLGVHCSTCHAAISVGDGQAPLPPADTIWSLAPAQMVFENRTPRELCEQLKDPEINGGRGHVASTRHIEVDHLLQTSWHMGRTPPPISHEELVQRFETWGRAGGPCP